ncbi:MAG: ABC transporter permease [Dehalogenimonas sp.]|uniref:ABC transporter permease n=1 Tax=Candidatus Dehalogenimonas loeffleri TaxID=3127115 RepID=A0ABZ2J2D9_9CHLR|nr:ABC transporter permease [Dehalogenimonas sp.]
MTSLKSLFGRLKKNPLSIIGIVIIVSFIFVAALAPIIAPPPEGHVNSYMIPRDGFSAVPKPPSDDHIFGTTQGQYDVFYGVIWGTRTAFQIGLIVIGAIVVIGLFLGSVAGYFGGIIDDIIMRITDVFLAFPSLILAMAITIALGPSIPSVMLALILVSWPSYARMIRGEILAIREEDYVTAARGAGSSDLRIITRHILPNSIYPVLVMASLEIGAVVLSAAALSFLGLGPQEGYADWGQMISFARNWITGTANNPFAYWHAITIPGIFIFLFVLGWNLLGDAFRDILDPRLSKGR